MSHVTHSTKPIKEREIVRKWYEIDISKEPLGRIVPRIVHLLQGKNKTTYTPHLDSGEYVVVINAEKVTVTGAKSDNKVYTYYSGYPGGLKELSFKTLLQKKPEEIVRHAVSGMLPKNKLRDKRMSRLFIYRGSEHPYKEKIQ